jgi:hypothetical protein
VDAGAGATRYRRTPHPVKCQPPSVSPRQCHLYWLPVIGNYQKGIPSKLSTGPCLRSAGSRPEAPRISSQAAPGCQSSFALSATSSANPYNALLDVARALKMARVTQVSCSDDARVTLRSGTTMVRFLALCHLIQSPALNWQTIETQPLALTCLPWSGRLWQRKGPSGGGSPGGPFFDFLKTLSGVLSLFLNKIGQG